MPAQASVRALQNAAADGAKVISIAVSRNADSCFNPAAAKRTDGSPLHSGPQLSIQRLRVRLPGAKHAAHGQAKNAKQRGAPQLFHCDNLHKSWLPGDCKRAILIRLRSRSVEVL